MGHPAEERTGKIGNKKNILLFCRIGHGENVSVIEDHGS